MPTTVGQEQNSSALMMISRQAVSHTQQLYVFQVTYHASPDSVLSVNAEIIDTLSNESVFCWKGMKGFRRSSAKLRLDS